MPRQNMYPLKTNFDANQKLHRAKTAQRAHIDLFIFFLSCNKRTLKFFSLL